MSAPKRTLKGTSIEVGPEGNPKATPNALSPSAKFVQTIKGDKVIAARVEYSPDGMDLMRHPATGDWRLRRQGPDLKPVYEVLIEEHHVAWLVNALAPYAGGPVAAAPELLEALEEIVQANREILERYNHGANDARACAVISKVRGGS